MKRCLFVLVVLCSLIVSVPAFAANRWYNNIVVEQVGSLGAGNAYAVLTDPAGQFTNHGFIMQSSEANKSGLATLLTALSLNRPVSIYADVDANTINIIIVKRAN